MLPLQDRSKAGGNNSKHVGLPKNGLAQNALRSACLSDCTSDRGLLQNASTTPLALIPTVSEVDYALESATQHNTHSCKHAVVNDRHADDPTDCSDADVAVPRDDIVACIAANFVTECYGPDEVLRRVRECFVRCEEAFRGTQLEDTTYIAANRTPGVNKKGAKRQGAKAIKKLERISALR